MDPEIRTSFHIAGDDFSPEDITQQLGIIPDEIWYKGDQVKNLKLIRKQTAWCLTSELETPSLNINDYIVPLIEVLYPKREILVSVCNGLGLYCEISCVIEIVNQAPILHLDPDISGKIHDLNTHLDFDIYCFREEDSERLC